MASVCARAHTRRPSFLPACWFLSSSLSAFYLVGAELLLVLRQRFFCISILQFPCDYLRRQVKLWHACSEQTKGVGIFRLATHVKLSCEGSWSAASVRCCAASSMAVTWRCFISPKKVAATRSMSSKTVGLKSKLERERESSVATVTVDLKCVRPFF